GGRSGHTGPRQPLQPSAPQYSHAANASGSSAHSRIAAIRASSSSRVARPSPTITSRMLAVPNSPTANSANQRVPAASPYTSGAWATPSVRANPASSIRLRRCREYLALPPSCATASSNNRGPSARSGRSAEITNVPISSSQAAARPPDRRTRRSSASANGLADVHHHRVRVGDVERRVLEQQLVDRGRQELGVVDRLLGCGLPRRLDLPWVGVDSDDSTGRDRRREVEGDAADAAAGVEDGHARAQMREQERQERASVATADVATLDAFLDDVAL